MAEPDPVRKLARKLKTPWEIQGFVSSIPYNPDDFCKSAKRVLIERTAHCMEGALLSCLLLEELGEPTQNTRAFVQAVITNNEALEGLYDAARAADELTGSAKERQLERRRERRIEQRGEHTAGH